MLDETRAAFAAAAAGDGIVLESRTFGWLCEQGHIGLERVAKARRDPAIVPQPGDILLFRFGRSPSHAAIVAREAPHLTAVHSFRGRGVIEDECGSGSAHVTRLAGMADSVRRLGELAGTAPVAARKAGDLRAEYAAISARYRGRPPLKVLYQIWDQPIYTIGGKHVISDALELCGATNIFADLKTAAPAVTREAAVLRDPDLIVVSAPPQAGAE